MRNIIRTRAKGFTLIELLVAITIAAVLILMIAHISSIAISSHNAIRRDNQVYAEVFSVFSFIEHALRNTYSVGVDSVNNRLTADNRTFYVSGTSFNFDENGTVNTLLDGVNGLNFTFTCDPVGGAWGTCTSASAIFRIDLSGTKDGEAFNISTDITRRNL
jgi:prepilin-type N-terminal cleavage/methylation domain-containing protein